MPKHAHLEVDLECPDCGARVLDLVWFGWGYCANYGVVDEYVYRVGDSIRWATADDGSIPPWVYFHFDNHGGNLGDPAITDLIVQEACELRWNDRSRQHRCPKCQRAIEGAAIEIRGGKIVRAWIFERGELDPEIDIHTFDEHGEIVPRRDLSNHPMEMYEGGSPPLGRR